MAETFELRRGHTIIVVRPGIQSLTGYVGFIDGVPTVAGDTPEDVLVGLLEVLGAYHGRIGHAPTPGKKH
jgi:hypothetical protein